MDGSTPFDAWYHDLHAICGAYDGVPRRGQTRVRGRIAVHGFDGLDVADVSGDVARIERDSAGIRRDEAEHIFFLIEMRGGTRITHNGTQAELAAGDCLLLDSTRTGRLEMAPGASRLLSVHLPRQTFLGERRAGLRIGHRLAAADPAAQSLSRQFFRYFAPAGGRPAPGRARLLFDLIHHAFAAPAPGLAGIDLTEASDRLTLALDLIDRHLGTDDLSLSWLADRLGVSERTAQRLFEAASTSFVEVVRTKRYRYVTEHLDRPGPVHGSIADLALRAGFRDLSNFNRGFRVRFGQSPREYHRSRQAIRPKAYVDLA